MHRILPLSHAFGLAAASATGSANTVELITNGGFETGTFAGWTVSDFVVVDEIITVDSRKGTWFAYDTSSTTPLSGRATLGPAAGSFYAVSDQAVSGAHILEQTFTVPVDAGSILLSFDMFINDWSDKGPIMDGGLDDTLGSNQYAPVDLMTSVAGPLSTSAADIVANRVGPAVDTNAAPNAYTSYVFDPTGLVNNGATYKLRFAEADSQFFLNQGVDNVSILTQQIPKPGTCTLLARCVGVVALARSLRPWSSMPSILRPASATGVSCPVCC